MASVAIAARFDRAPCISNVCATSAFDFAAQDDMSGLLVRESLIERQPEHHKLARTCAARRGEVADPKS